MTKFTFATAVNCMDGRTQEPVIAYIKKRFAADYVDMITEPGIDFILSQAKDRLTVAAIKRRINISVQKHHSVIIAVAGHADCAGNPACRDEHCRQIKESVALVAGWGFDVPVIGLWLDDKFRVEEIMFERNIS